MPDNGAARRGEERGEERDDIWEKGQQFTGIHRRRGFRQGILLHGILTVGSLLHVSQLCGILVPGDSFALASPSRCPFFFLLILAPILTTVKFIAIVRQEVSRSFLSSFLPALGPPVRTLISFLQNASPFPRDEWRFSDGGVEGGRTIKQFPTAHDSIYRTVMASKENPTAIK